MVGLVIGIVAVIVVLQVFALSESRKRTSTSGSEAQSDGVIALYQLQRDIGQAGYGLAVPSLLNCPLAAPVGAATLALAPVTINPAVIPAGDANTDTLLIIYGNPNGQPQGYSLPVSVINSSAFALNDWVMAAPATCPVPPAKLSLEQVTSASGATPVTTPSGPAGVTLYNLGSPPAGPTILAYAIRGGNLTVCNYMTSDCSLAANTGNAAVWVPIASNIVSLKAQYGYDTQTPLPVPPPPAMPSPPVDQTVYAQLDTFFQPTTAQPAPTAALAANSAACNWTRIPAIRLALVARSAQLENEKDKISGNVIPVTTAAPTWAGTTVIAAPPTAANPIVNPIAVPIDLSGLTNWQNYRYKVFETVAPIRNVAWMGVPVGC